MRSTAEGLVTPLKSSVLIIDDDEGMARTLSAILAKAGYAVSTAPTGRQGIEVFKTGRDPESLCIVLLDIRLPDLNGVQVLKELKKIDPHVGAIMITGNADMESAVSSLHEGAAAYVTKPYNIDEVKSFIQKAFERQQLIVQNSLLMKQLQNWNVELEKTIHEKTAELKTKNMILLEVVEKLKVLNELKSRFVANASHELQTPMTSILGFSSMLLDYWDKVDHTQITRFLQIIRDEAQRLSRSSRDLLDLSRIQDGKMQLECQKINLKDVANQVAENLRVIKNTVAVDVEFEAGSEEIWSDPDKIRQVFTNLMGNALKYSPDGSNLRVTGKMRGEVVIVSILDQGPGIPADKREKIFEPFYRIHDDVGKRVRGTGLGLSIAKAIVEAMGGVIRVEGQTGKGSNFTFALPKELKSENGNLSA
ncbi:MAG: hypothetical protein A2901_04225 [Elusimicrobia bacterium RIFCSPLOWO2_01_FULL_54_10]|nr:MAG: hypothetical protein A2901_04225 [Elusimicrobia bacterium RIFCSPLOWO2_01_FULL_54_10]